MSEFGTDEKNRMSLSSEDTINKTADENCEVITTCTKSTYLRNISNGKMLFLQEKKCLFFCTGLVIFISNMYIK